MGKCTRSYPLFRHNGTACILLSWLLATQFGCDLGIEGVFKLPPETIPENPRIDYRGADLSFLPEVRQSGLRFTNAAGIPEDMLTTLQDSGLNVVRLRLFHSPSTPSSSLSEVKAFAESLRYHHPHLHLLLAIHYSDTWADPGAQRLPAPWEGLTLPLLLDSLEAYTAKVCREIKPDIVQLGNEINGGLLWPFGRIESTTAFRTLMSRAIGAVRRVTPKAQVMLHIAGMNEAAWVLNTVSPLDYDLIGFSYYPMWHGKIPANAISTFDSLATVHSRKFMVVETSYPFTLGWNDWTHNVLGLASQLAPGFDATADGQSAFILMIKTLIRKSRQGIGFCYWGGEWVSYKGPQATDGSSYENQALWDFERHALPVIGHFKK